MYRYISKNDPSFPREVLPILVENKPVQCHTDVVLNCLIHNLLEIAAIHEIQ